MNVRSFHLLALLVLVVGVPATSRAADLKAVDFDTQIMPVLTRGGCNVGSCHGSAVGRGGFKLSLYGSNPAADHRAIVHGLEGRRVNLARPAESLVLQKPTEQLVHGGGERFSFDSTSAGLLQAWIAQGAARRDAGPLKALEIVPATATLPKLGSSVSLKATAVFGTGRRRDVTAWVVWTAVDADSVQVDPTAATAKVLRRGRHTVMARFLDSVVPVILQVPLREDPVTLDPDSRSNFIDRLVLARLQELHLPVSPQAPDTTFLRRVRLDLTGRLPTPAEVEAFGGDRRSDRRVRLVDRLLADDGFVEYWTYRLADWLRVRAVGRDDAAARAFRGWIGRQLGQGTGFDTVAASLLTAEGDSHEVSPAAFYRVGADPRLQAEYVSQSLLGVRLRCANCHDHPLDCWSQDDYHGLAALFAGIDRGRVVGFRRGAVVTHPATGTAARPRLPGGAYLEGDRDHRGALAKWLTARENPFFARAFVNRAWREMMGRGLVEPVDDHRATNPPTHPRLLDLLATFWANEGYRLRPLLRQIALSEAYGRTARSVPGNRGDDSFYSHALLRPMSAEVLIDAIGDVTGVAPRFGKEPPGTRAIQLPHSEITSRTLDVLGRCGRGEACGDAAGTRDLAARLHLLNSNLINSRLVDAAGRLQRQLDAGTKPGKIVEKFFVRAVGRSPTPAERDFLQRQIKRAGSRGTRAVMQDVIWSLLNGREFTTNH